MISTTLGMEKDFLHIPFGIMIFALLAVILQRRHRTLLRAFIGLMIVQGLNEGLDAVNSMMLWGTVSWREAVTDTLRTLAIPGGIVIAVHLVIRARDRRRDPFARLAVRGENAAGE